MNRWIMRCLMGVVALAPATADGTVLVWRGCEVAQEAFMERCAAAYLRRTGVRIRLAGGGATVGIEGVAARAADLGGTCRNCIESRGEKALPIRFAVVAWDAVVVVVHPDNPVAGLSLAQIREVFTERLTDWKQLGWSSSRRISVVVRRDETSGVGVMCRRMFWGDESIRFGPTALRLAQASDTVEEMVAGYEHAIAFSGASSARRRALKMLAVDGVAPTVDAVATGRYPYYRPLYLSYGREPSAAVLAFRDWLLGAEGQTEIEATGTISLERGRTLAATYPFDTTGPPIDNLEALRARARAPQ